MPSIQFVNRVFAPVHGATGRLVANLAGWFVAEGWRVEVLTCAATASESKRDGIEVVRVAAPQGRGLTAAGHQLAALAQAGLRRPCPDVAVTLTDPPLLALLGLLYRRRGAATIHWCHDLNPHLLPTIGSRIPAAGQGLLHRLSRRAMAAHDAVVAIGECMAVRLADGAARQPATVHRSKLVVVPNWPDPAIRPDPAAAAFRVAEGLGRRFVVMYSGNFGRAHPMDAVLDAAATLRTTRPDIVFAMIGSGARYGETVAAARRRGLTNMRFLPFQPPERLPATLSAADLHLAMQAGGTTGMMVPCKIAGALAAGRPCLLLGPADGAAARLLTSTGAGLVLPPGDGAGLATTLAHLAERPPEWTAMAERTAAAVAPLRLERAAPAFVRLAEGLVARRCGCHTAPGSTSAAGGRIGHGG